MEDFYHYLIKTNQDCVKEIKESEIKAMSCIVIFATRSYDLVKKMVQCVRQQKDDIKIILVARAYMLPKAKECLRDSDLVIVHEGNYSDEVVDKIKEYGYPIDGVFFYTLQKHDLGNLNLLTIASKLNEEAIVYGINKEEEIYEFFNLKLYLFGLHLYLKIDEYIEEVEKIKC